MKRILVALTVLMAFMCGCCCHKQCIKDDQADKSKIEAKKALNEMDKEKAKDADQ
ncbi:MAG TPA: hypothetical protein VF335_07590 [Chitinivibrionales bacterium]